MSAILTDSTLKNVPIQIQCTYANAFVNPEFRPNECIISYDRSVLARNNSTDHVIGSLTGNYTTNETTGEVWLQAKLNFCNRMENGWFRLRDIWFVNKGEPQNDADPLPKNKNKSALAWITAGLTLLSSLR